MHHSGLWTKGKYTCIWQSTYTPTGIDSGSDLSHPSFMPFALSRGTLTNRLRSIIRTPEFHEIFRQFHYLGESFVPLYDKFLGSFGPWYFISHFLLCLSYQSVFTSGLKSRENVIPINNGMKCRRAGTDQVKDHVSSVISNTVILILYLWISFLKAICLIKKVQGGRRGVTQTTIWIFFSRLVLLFHFVAHKLLKRVRNIHMLCLCW